jgi:hypothetical protein
MAESLRRRYKYWMSDESIEVEKEWMMKCKEEND